MADEQLSQEPEPKQLLPEPLLLPDPRNNTLFPLDPRFSALMQYALQHQKQFWTVGEVHLADDDPDMRMIRKKEPSLMRLILRILAFFASADGIVMENLSTNFGAEITCQEAKQWYAFQNAMESIHSHMYSVLIEKYAESPEQQAELLNAVETLPSVSAKAKWVKQHMNPSMTLARRLLAFAVVEGLFFISSFVAIFYIRKRNMLPGLVQSNDLIAADESLHVEVACWMYRECIQNKLTQQEFNQMIQDAVENCEKPFIDDALPEGIVGLSAELMKQYVEFHANEIAARAGYENPYPCAVNPFEWMKTMGMYDKGNFFEKRNGNYQQLSVGGQDPFAEGSDDSDF